MELRKNCLSVIAVVDLGDTREDGAEVVEAAAVMNAETEMTTISTIIGMDANLQQVQTGPHCVR